MSKKTKTILIALAVLGVGVAVYFLFIRKKDDGNGDGKNGGDSDGKNGDTSGGTSGGGSTSTKTYTKSDLRRVAIDYLGEIDVSGLTKKLYNAKDNWLDFTQWNDVSSVLKQTDNAWKILAVKDELNNAYGEASLETYIQGFLSDSNYNDAVKLISKAEGNFDF